MSINNAILSLIKYSDDMALISCLKDRTSLSDYFHQIEQLRDWFKKSFLELNVGKTKEFICGKSRVNCTLRAICFSQQVEIVQSSPLHQ